jgi:hypothetical protein
MAGIVTAMLLGTLVLAPAGKAAPTKPGVTLAAKSDVTEAKRLYSIGEKVIVTGKAAQAVSLWRRAIVLLPPTAAYDDLRHKLVLRLGYGMIIAAEQTGDREFAVDAAYMLDRYAARHEQLFGDGAAAEKQRGEVYELLYEVETKLEEMPGAPEHASTEPAVQADEGAPEISERHVVVPSKRRLDRPDANDPKVRAALDSRQNDPYSGLVMTAPGARLLHPARGLVRMHGLARPIVESNDADHPLELHGLARAAFLSVRPALRGCYDAAFARTPTDVVDTEVELVLETDGTVSAAKITGAPVVDAIGTRCVAARLADARIADGHPDKRVRMRMPLVFFWRDAEFIDEASGASGRNALDFVFRQRSLNHGSYNPMPPIDRGMSAPMRGRRH